MIIFQFTYLPVVWTPGKNSAFPDLLSRNFSLKELNGHQLVHKEIPEDIIFFNQNGHEVQYFIDHKSSADDKNDKFHPIVWNHQCETKTPHLKNDGTDMICTNFDLKSPKALFNVSHSSREGKNINNRRN